MSFAISGLETPDQVRGLDLTNQELTQKSADPALNDRDGFDLPIQKKFNVEIRWYLPDHMHLVIRRQHCAAACGGLDVWHVSNASRSHIAIQVPVTWEQEEALERFIDSTAQERAIPMDTCAGSSAYILRKYTDLQIPRIIASFPACSTSYLLFQKMLGNRKIGDVEFRGDMGNSYNCLSSRFCFLVFPVVFLGEASTLLKLGYDATHAMIKDASLGDANRFIGRLFPVQGVSDFMNPHLEYFSEVSKDLDFKQTAELLFALFIVVGLCTALTSVLIGSVRKNLFYG